MRYYKRYAYPILIFIIVFVAFLMATNAVNYSNNTINWTLSFNYLTLFSLTSMIDYIFVASILIFIAMIYSSIKEDRY